MIVALVGRRQHYAVPRAFHQCDALSAFITDYWVAGNLRRLLEHAPWNAFAPLLGRWHPELPSNKVAALPRLIPLHLKRKIRIKRDNLYDYYCSEGSLFAKNVNALCERRFGAELANYAYFGFTSTSLETLALFADAGAPTILDQIDPLCTEHQIIRAEREKWPGWETSHDEPSQGYIDRVKEEWHRAAYVLVNSDWSAKALVAQGVPQKKIMVVPQAYEGPVIRKKQTYDGKRPLRVLWLGSVILRKGIQYLMKSSLSLGKAIEVRVVGPIGIAIEKVRTAPSNMAFLGQIPHTLCRVHFEWADVFILPTLSDGFGMTQLEAMAHGLPVITTRRCGQVVEDGKNGLVVKAGSTSALVAALASLAEDPELVEYMSSNAVKTVAKFTLDRFAGSVLGHIAASDYSCGNPSK
jgi:glycosyltransferase involved in cell wall biosynthesis